MALQRRACRAGGSGRSACGRRRTRAASRSRSRARELVKLQRRLVGEQGLHVPCVELRRDVRASGARRSRSSRWRGWRGRGRARARARLRRARWRRRTSPPARFQIETVCPPDAPTGGRAQCCGGGPRHHELGLVLGGVRMWPGAGGAGSRTGGRTRSKCCAWAGQAGQVHFAGGAVVSPSPAAVSLRRWSWHAGAIDGDVHVRQRRGGEGITRPGADRVGPHGDGRCGRGALGFGGYVDPSCRRATASLVSRSSALAKWDRCCCAAGHHRKPRHRGPPHAVVRRPGRYRVDRRSGTRPGAA